MRTLFITMGVVETATGLALLVVPSLVAVILLGLPLDGAVGLVVARICGAGLLSLGIACLLGRDEAGAPAAGLLVAMLVYNATTTGVLAYSRFGMGLMGIMLWPAIVVHAALAIWCVVCLRRPRALQART
jgi:hypothetical protein